MKIGIVTITNDGYNYGNRLQNFALQTVLERMGYYVETLNRPIRENQRKWWKHIIKVLHYIVPFCQKIKHRKAGNFFFWNTKYIRWSRVLAVDGNLSQIAGQYDYFVAGSDQIWNPSFLWGDDPYMFLRFARPEQRVAYAPSIGLDYESAVTSCSHFKEMWKDWRALSCREKSGARIMSELTGGTVPCLIDPTLLLPANDWKMLTRYFITPRRYIVLYMLGELTGEYKQYVDDLSNRTGCRVIDMVNDFRYAGCGPSRFVALIQHADWVVSDSFHACAFSIIFHRPFTILDRAGLNINMNSRIETILEKCKIDVQEWTAKTEINPTDWNVVDMAIATEQHLAMRYLKQALR